MRSFLILLTVLALCSFGWAQGEGEMDYACSQSVTVSDATCSSPINCQSDNGCPSAQFTASCSGYYTLTVSLNCPSGRCTDYNVCANVTEDGTNIANCHINVCQGCGYDCPNICLIAGHTYKFYVCLTACDFENDPCPDPVTCSATGKIGYCGVSTVCQ